LSGAKVHSGARFHPDQGGLQVGREGNQLLLRTLLPQQDLAGIAKSYEVKGCLAKIDATERICISMILLEPTFKILHTVCEVQAADHLSSRVTGN
jgi:hypothetical protein